MFKLREKLDNVRDATTFIDFLIELHKDLPSDKIIKQVDPSNRYLVGVDGWMNLNLEDFLEAAIAGGTDNKVGKDANDAETAWKSAAEILYLGKIYE